MRNAIVIAALLFSTQSAFADTRSAADEPAASWRPVLSSVANTTTDAPSAKVTAAYSRDRRAALLGFDPTAVPVKTWSAQVEYQHTIDRPDMLAAVARNEETARPGFATVQRSFGSGEFRPYVGVGVGVAATQFDTVMPTTDDAFAVKGVVGSNLIFTEKVGGYMQYDYAVATESAAATGDRKSHGVSFGLRISLQ